MDVFYWPLELSEHERRTFNSLDELWEFVETKTPYPEGYALELSAITSIDDETRFLVLSWVDVTE